jgi:hypothetical protein
VCGCVREILIQLEFIRPFSATVCESPTWQSVSLQPLEMCALLQTMVFLVD